MVQIIFVRIGINKLCWNIAKRLIQLNISFAALCAEVEEVKVTWTPGLCQEKCIKGLEQRFNKIPQLMNLSINQPAGVLKFQWNPTQPFTFTPINHAMEWIGLSINGIWVQVKGTIEGDGKIFRIISSKDNTSFTLMTRVYTTDPHQYVEEFNPENRFQLSPGTQEKLKEAQKNRQKVTIMGPLFEPERSPPLQLVIQQMTVEELPKKPKAK